MQYELLSVLLLSVSLRLELIVAQCDSDCCNIRQTNNGPVEGMIQSGIFGKKFYAFRGIPYAETPITGIDPNTGEKVDRRFKAPEQLSRKWTEPLKVENFRDGCITSATTWPTMGITSEDCLFVNIYVPVGGVTNKTVLVYIHGGGFVEGTSDDVFHGPDFLVDADNILVTFNYRVGIFGFMNLGFGEYTGNMGLKDQQLALKWIYENIEHFSGNPNEIMLFGQSAGGASVNFHMLNKESRKYFNRAYTLSSTALNYYALSEQNHLERMKRFAKIEDDQQLVEYLKNAKNVALSKIESNNSYGVLIDYAWGPTIESPETAGAFITKTAKEIYESDDTPVMDTMFSFTSQEFLVFSPDLNVNSKPLLPKNWKFSKLSLPFRGFDRDTYPDEYKHAVRRLKNHYFKDRSDDAIKRGNIALLSDANFVYDILKTVRYQVMANNKETPKNTFVLRLGVNTELNYAKNAYKIDFDGMSHADEMCYIFRCNLFDSYKIYKDALRVRDDSNVIYRTINRMVGIITNFARTGNPSMQGDTLFKSSTSPDEIFCQDITNEPKTGLVPDILNQIHFNTWREIDYIPEAPLLIRQTNNGPVDGTIQTSIFGKRFYSYKGIPYAEAPITGIDPNTGDMVDRRFKAPEELKRTWTEPLRAKVFGDGCITSSSLMLAEGNTNENCLFLNIFVPNGGAEKKTVLVYLHGGGFIEGTSNDFIYGPDFLIDVDNILVTLNYRVGIFGFINLNYGEYNGNMGLKDQQLALKWIYENIEHFSGNPNEIMLFGESAGGASVNFQMLNKESRKYFNRAFIMSSSALNYYALSDTNHMEKMKNITNIQGELQLLEYLRTANSALLAKQKVGDLRMLLEFHWNPTIESPETKGAFITKHPDEIYESDDAPVMDTMFSFNSQEYVTFNVDLAKTNKKKKNVPLLTGNWKDSKFLLPFHGYDKDTYPEKYQDAFDMLKDAYFKDATDLNAIKRANIGLLSDSNFVYHILKAARYQVISNNKETPKNTFILRFSVSGNMGIFRTLMDLKTDGAAHGDEVCYVFRCGFLDNQGVNENALQVRDDTNVNYRTVRRMVDIITNFARTGDPSVEGDTPFKSSTSPDQIFGQDITNDPNSILLTDVLQQSRYKTWMEIDEMYHQLNSTDNDQNCDNPPCGDEKIEFKLH